jgi:ubiquinone/menaquinone biosynthesis C-methylase UbiE
VTDERKSVVASGYDAISERYLAWSSLIDDRARSRFLNEFVDRMAPGSEVLDLGCGAGLPSTRTLAERFIVTGVDLSSRQIEAARRNVPSATFIQADLAAIDFPDASFDGVTALYVLSHVPRDEHGEVFRRIARWLRPGGLFLASLGADDSSDWFGEWLDTPMFFSSFDAAENRRLVEDAGFDVLVADVVDLIEPEGPTPFLWVLGQRRRGG